MKEVRKKEQAVVVAMSGGVDSSVATALLKEEGYGVIGITMHLWDFESVGGNNWGETACCSPEAMRDAQAVCHQLGIPHYVVDFREEFEKNVIQNFIDEYLRGRTPNPCVICNTRMKWGCLLKKAQELGAEWLATGHYARVTYDQNRGRYLLLKGADPSKDQSYALWGLTQANLERTILPLGKLNKERVRDIADQLGLKTANRGESQEICFIPDDDYGRFLSEKVPDLIERVGQGEILDSEGTLLGHHRGYPFYTIGQRRGLGIAVGKPLYVTQVDPERNRIFVGDNEELMSQGLVAEALNLISVDQLSSEMEVEVKIRYNDTGFKAALFPMPEGKAKVIFYQPQRAVTPGQSVVFYDGEEVVGGGMISSSVNKF